MRDTGLRPATDLAPPEPAGPPYLGDRRLTRWRTAALVCLLLLALGLGAGGGALMMYGMPIAGILASLCGFAAIEAGGQMLRRWRE